MVHLERHFTTSAGQRMAYVATGSGPSVVLLHGLGGTADFWQPVIAALAPHFTVIAPDLLGFGASDKPPAGYSLVLDDEGFNFAQAGEDHFIPTVPNVEQFADLTLHWMNAALSKRKNHLFAIKLDFGWVGEICLDDVWYEVIPRSANPFNYEQRITARNTAIQRLKDRLKADYTADTQAFLERFEAMPERLNTTVDGHYQLPEESQQAGAEVGTESNEQPTIAQGNSGKTRKQTEAAQREQLKPRLDWSDLL